MNPNLPLTILIELPILLLFKFDTTKIRKTFESRKLFTNFNRSFNNLIYPRVGDYTSVFNNCHPLSLL